MNFERPKKLVETLFKRGGLKDVKEELEADKVWRQQNELEENARLEAIKDELEKLKARNN